MKHKKVVFIGGGVHTFAINDMLLQHKNRFEVFGYVDPQKSTLSMEYLGDDENFVNNAKINKAEIFLMMGVGINVKLREKLFNFYKSKNYKFLTYIHPHAIISPTAIYEEGVIIFPGAVIGANVYIEKNVLIHSNSVVEHRTRVGANSYLAPGVTIAGECVIGKSTLLGINTTVTDFVSIKQGTVIGAGAVVTKSFEKENILLMGIPAKEVTKSVQ